MSEEKRLSGAGWLGASGSHTLPSVGVPPTEGCRLEPPRRGWASEVTTWAQRALCPFLPGCQAEVEPSAAGHVSPAGPSTHTAVSVEPIHL